MAAQRILVIGCSGAGKSTLAGKIAARLGLPVIHLDHEYWLPGWKTPMRQDWRDKVARLVAHPAWVMDGNYANTFDLRMPRAQMIVFLDLPRWLALYGILYRPLRYWGQQRGDMAPGCIERYDWSFLRYVWNFKRVERPKIMSSIDAFGTQAELVHLTSRAAVAQWLNRLSAQNAIDVDSMRGAT